MSEFIGIGDLHFPDSTGKGGLAAYIDDAPQQIVREVSKVKAYARKKHVTHIVQYGDVCEGPRASYASLLAMIDMVADDDLKWTFILGNHDKFAKESSAGHSLELLKRMRLPNVRIVEEQKLLKVGTQKLNFMPWPCTEFSTEYLNVAHVDVAGSTGDNGRPTKSDVKPRGLSVIGHIHTHQVVGRTHYSGTLYQTYFGETKEKFFHHATHDSGGWEIESVPHTPDYELVTLEVTSRKDLRKIEDDPKKLYKLKLSKASSLTAADYGSNVVRIQAVGDDVDAEATLAATREGSSVVLDPDEFFEAWMDRQTLPSPLKDRALKLRKEMLYAK
jgi:hypothetical protein